ncbi:(4Fe-4S)-binding protein [Methyloceanibacter sp.]|uniref:(4Fe-4S)-binding protein n=1 Tax=Methyloceanibacter sp. TaxID=1965321 RepID=UPI003D6D679F
MSVQDGGIEGAYNLAAAKPGGDNGDAPMPEYRNDKVVVRYDPKICIHAGECVRGLPSVFNVSKKPWIDVSGASADVIAEQVKRCPSGALTYELLKKAE